MLTIKIIRPASRESGNSLAAQVIYLENQGFKVKVGDTPVDDGWTYSSGAAGNRARVLIDALLDANVDIILAARGGYGCSDLLPMLPWEKLKQTKAKIIAGFSDVSALHSAFYTQLGWQSGLHSPMPATTLWRKDGVEDDVEKTLDLFKAFYAGQTLICDIPLGEHNPALKRSGKLFGGCFTVLSNLIGTPYFPRDLSDHILFFEDTDENPARLIRAFNQWLQSGALAGVSAIVIGNLRNLGAKIPDCAQYVYQEFAKRTQIPVFNTPLFGHTSPNFPLLIGADATVSNNILSWQYGSSKNV